MHLLFFSLFFIESKDFYRDVGGNSTEMCLIPYLDQLSTYYFNKQNKCFIWFRLSGNNKPPTKRNGFKRLKNHSKLDRPHSNRSSENQTSKNITALRFSVTINSLFFKKDLELNLFFYFKKKRQRFEKRRKTTAQQKFSINKLLIRILVCKIPCGVFSYVILDSSPRLISLSSGV